MHLPVFGRSEWKKKLRGLAEGFAADDAFAPQSRDEILPLPPSPLPRSLCSHPPAPTHVSHSLSPRFLDRRTQNQLQAGGAGGGDNGAWLASAKALLAQAPPTLPPGSCHLSLLRWTIAVGETAGVMRAATSGGERDPVARDVVSCVWTTIRRVGPLFIHRCSSNQSVGRGTLFSVERGGSPRRS